MVLFWGEIRYRGVKIVRSEELGVRSAEIYDTTKQNISQHIDNILNDGELNVSRTVKEFLTVRQEGNRQVKRNIAHYNLDMIIALGYRIQSQVATRFRRWATQRLQSFKHWK